MYYRPVLKYFYGALREDLLKGSPNIVLKTRSIFVDAGVDLTCSFLFSGPITRIMSLFVAIFHD
jgi:hypothetical protein